MRRQVNPFIVLAILASAVIGLGISLINWGDPEGVHGTGLPVPVSISGIPEDEPALVLEDLFSSLGFFSVLLNTLFVAVAGFFVWAVIALTRQFFFGV